MHDDLAHRLLDIYDRLLAAYGPQGWWPADSPFEVIVGAILTQNTAWTNVEKAIAHLRAAGALTPAGLLALTTDEIARLIRPAGYFNTKARKLRAFGEFLAREHAGDLDRLFALDTAALRATLLGIYGIGPETADSILLYAAGRPVFVVDAYTRRVFSRLGLVSDTVAYHDLQALFSGHLPPDVALFNEYHALIVRHGKGRCTRRRPGCVSCPLDTTCVYHHPSTSV